MDTEQTKKYLMNKRGSYIAGFLTENETQILLTYLSGSGTYYTNMLEGTGLTIENVDSWAKYMIEIVLPAVDMMVEPSSCYMGLLYQIYTPHSERSTYEGYEACTIENSIFLGDWKETYELPTDTTEGDICAVYGRAAALPYMYALARNYDQTVVRRQWKN